MLYENEVCSLSDRLRKVTRCAEKTGPTPMDYTPTVIEDPLLLWRDARSNDPLTTSGTCASAVAPSPFSNAFTVIKINRGKKMKGEKRGQKSHATSRTTEYATSLTKPSRSCGTQIM